MCPPVPRSTSRFPNALQPLTTPPRLTSSTRLPLIGGRVEELPRLTDARVVDHDVGHAVLGAHLVGEPFDGFGVRHVKHVRVRDTAALDDLGGGVLDARLVDVADDQFGACAGEGQRGLPADAAARAGDRHQRVAEVVALAADLCAQQRPTGGLALEEVDKFADGGSQHLRMRHRRPVAGVDVAPPQPRHPAGQVVEAVRPHHRVLGADDQLHRAR